VCGISAEAESSELARLNIDAHMQVSHPAVREAVRARRPDPGRPGEEDDRG
jgi:hypothetical protein